MIQKEEERARRKIQETKERAAEIIALRQENERRVQAYVNATGEVRQLQQVMLAKNREQDQEGRKAREQRLQILQSKKKEEVGEMQMEKKYLSALMLQDQQRIIEEKQRKRDEVKKAEELIRMKKEQERLERERKRKEFYAKKLHDEEVEAKKAEKLVKLLERKEREWIERLRTTQTIQDTAFEQLEHALDNHIPLRVSISRAQETRDFYDGSGNTPNQSMSYPYDPYPSYANNPANAERIPEYDGNGGSRGPQRVSLSPIENDYNEYYQQQQSNIDSSRRVAAGAPMSSNQSTGTGSSGKRSNSSSKLQRTGSGIVRNTPGLKGKSGHH